MSSPIHAFAESPPQTPQSPQTPGIPTTTPDPAIQAAIEADFCPVPLALGSPDNSVALCKRHSLEKCSDCDVDFVLTNRLAKLLILNPNIMCPPPPNIISQKLSQTVTNMKEEGNTLFKKGFHTLAISRYTAAANMVVQRPPWEASQVMREELSTVISNRSAAYFEAGDYISALVDADTVISIRRNWSKGHFRKSKALLGLGKLQQAKDAIRLGLSFEPMNSELNSFLADIDRVGKVVADKKAKQRSQKSVPVPSPTPSPPPTAPEPEPEPTPVSTAA